MFSWNDGTFYSATWLSYTWNPRDPHLGWLCERLIILFQPIKSIQIVVHKSKLHQKSIWRGHFHSQDLSISLWCACFLLINPFFILFPPSSPHLALGPWCRRLHRSPVRSLTRLRGLRRLWRRLGRAGALRDRWGQVLREVQAFTKYLAAAYILGWCGSTSESCKGLDTRRKETSTNIVEYTPYK